MNRDHGFPMFPRGEFRGGLIERVGESGGGWPDALAWAIFAVLLTLLVVALVSLALDAYYRLRGPRRFVKRISPGFPPGPVPAGGALAVLDVRYARGEMSRDEYLTARDDLAASVAEAPTEVVPPPEPPPEKKSDT